MATSEAIQNANSLFQQTGGTNMVGFVDLSGGRYLLEGGRLQINGGLATAGGILDCGGGTGTIQAVDSIVDFTGSVVNTASTSLAIGANSLSIVQPGFTPSEFASYSNAGLIHVLGTTLNVSAGTGFGGWGTITDPVACQGSINATASGAINLLNGLALSGTGFVDLGSGSLTVNDTSFSSLSGGSLTVGTFTIGSSAAGSFTQSGGTATVSLSLNLGPATGISGSYSLTGNGQLWAAQEYIGNGGSGVFIQSGGTHGVSNTLWLGYNGGTGSYNLTNGLIAAGSASEYIGYSSGSGSFTQSGGTNSASGLTIGYYQGNGSYSLSAGSLVGGYEDIGDDGIGSFTQSGGTHSFINMTLGSDNGTGTYHLTSGLILANSASEYIGDYSGVGTFTQSGGSHYVYSIVLGLGGTGTYLLSGSGLLSATTEQVENAASLLQQTSGTNSAAFVDLAGGRYLLAAGLLKINGGLSTAGGTLDGGGGSANIQASNSIVDLTGNVVNSASASLAVGSNSLVIIPLGFNPAEFHAYSNHGLTHVLGTTLNVSAGTGFGGWGTINDAVVCQVPSTPRLAARLQSQQRLDSFSGTGQVNLANGSLTVNDLVSGMSGGTLTASSLMVSTTRQWHFYSERRQPYCRLYPVEPRFRFHGNL